MNQGSVQESHSQLNQSSIPLSQSSIHSQVNQSFIHCQVNQVFVHVQLDQVFVPCQTVPVESGFYSLPIESKLFWQTASRLQRWGCSKFNPQPTASVTLGEKTISWICWSYLFFTEHISSCWPNSPHARQTQSRKSISKYLRAATSLGTVCQGILGEWGVSYGDLMICTLQKIKWFKVDYCWPIVYL